jgi:pyruvate, orthophosphate dikinase
MMGHRGCRLGITYPEITEMQARAIIEAALNVRAKGVDGQGRNHGPAGRHGARVQRPGQGHPRTAEQVFAERGERIEYMLGTMIETPRAALVADSIGKQAEFFSFGTNDLTQMTLGFSRDDAGKFLPTT